jgi:hypothetical protein
MRIEEMRSGRAYLGRRTAHGGVSRFESEHGHAFPPAPVEEQRVERPRRILPQTDLEKNQWSVVSFHGVEAGGLTYDQASRLMNVLGDNGITGLCIITDIAALKID